MTERLQRLLGIVARVATGAARGAVAGMRQSPERASNRDQAQPEDSSSESPADEEGASDDSTATPKQKDQSPPGRNRNRAERATLVASIIIVAALIALALYEHIANQEPAGTWLVIDLDLDHAQRRGDLYYVPFTVTNQGSDPAEAVTLIFEVNEGETVVEESTVSIDFLATSGSADGELITAHDPATHTIDARPATLLTP